LVGRVNTAPKKREAWSSPSPELFSAGPEYEALQKDKKQLFTIIRQIAVYYFCKKFRIYMVEARRDLANPPKYNADSLWGWKDSTSFSMTHDNI
jgi:hypothetical protein